jgi:DNA-binding CsgD family transcriptional regulator
MSEANDIALARREKVFRMRAADLMTTQQIADALGERLPKISNDLRWLRNNGYDMGAKDKTKNRIGRFIEIVSTHDDERFERADKKGKCLMLRRLGVPVAEIARQLGLDGKTVSNYIAVALKEHAVRNVDELRQLECARLDDYLERLKPRIDRGDDKAINAALRVSEQRARILGLFAPVKIEGTITEETEQDRELKEMINEARARNAVEKDKIAQAPPPESTLLQ